MLEFRGKGLYLALILAMICWGIAWPSAKVLTEYSTPLHIAGFRFLFTCAGLLLILLFLKVPLRVSKDGWLWIVIGGLLITAYNYLFFQGIKLGMPGAGGILTTTMTPIISYFLALAIAKRWPNKTEQWALTLGLISCFFLLHLWKNYQEVFQGGNIIFLISCFTWAFLSRVTAKASQYGSPLAFTFWMYVVSTLCLNLMTPFRQTVSLVTEQADLKFWLNIFFNGFINAGIATTIFFYVTTKLGAAKTSMFIYIVPFIAALSSWIALGEKIYWYSIVGGLIGIAAIVVINRHKLFPSKYAELKDE